MNTKAEPLEDQHNDKINLGLGLPYRSITFHHYVRESSLLCWSYFCLFLELLPHGKAGWGGGGKGAYSGKPHAAGTDSAPITQHFAP